MKIYINTDNTPATIASTYKISEGTGPIKPYTFSGNATSFEFKRGNDVEIEVAFAGTQAPTVAALSALTMGLKVQGQYDTLLALKAETKTFVADDDGLAVGTLKFNVSGSIIDEALKVNTGAEDDVASAAFSLEFQWTGTDGKIHATKTLSATITNNVIRDGDAPAGPGYNVGVVMLVECTQAEYDAIENKPEHVYYLITDAETAYVAKTDFVQVENNVNYLMTSVEELRQMIPETFGTATTQTMGVVKIAGSINDPTEYHVVNAVLLKSTTNGMAKFFATNSSPTAGNLGIHGKALFASQSGDNGGFYIAGGAGSTVSWTQWLTRYQRDRIRVYGKDNGVYEDFYLEPANNEENKKLKIARMKDIPTIDLSGLADLASDQQITGTKTILGKWLHFAADDVDLEQGGAVKISGSRGAMVFQSVGSTYFATINLYGLTKTETIAFKSDIPDITTKADQTALDALIARVAALEAAAAGT